MSNDPHLEQEPANRPAQSADTPHGPGIAQWDPRSEEVLQDQIAAYDRMRQKCPLAQSRYGYTSVFRHADVLKVVKDPETFSNAVSRFPSVPNGMDPPEHTPFRKLIEPYLDEAHMRAFAPACRQIANRLTSGVSRSRSVEFMAEFAQLFALDAQCSWLGWPDTLHRPLLQWTLKNHTATMSGDREAQAAVAQEVDGYIRELLAVRREAGAAAPDDITTHLLRNESLGRPLGEDEIVSILRNWTVGELGTIAASIGILAQYLA